MRVCLVYDCLYPYTVGGAERWYRNVGERLAGEGHEVTYLTLRQWPRDEEGVVPGVEVVAVGPRLELYTEGRRRLGPPVVFGLGVLVHLLRHRGRYDVVHTASFPYFSLLAAGLVRRLGRFTLLVDWHEVWTLAYWRDYLGRVGGPVGWGVQRLCLRLAQRAFCFSRLHRDRLRDEGFRGEINLLEGEYAGDLTRPVPVPAEPVVVFAGRHIPEKRAAALVPAIAHARASRPGLRAEIFGDGPERPELLRRIAAAGLGEVIDAPGFVDGERVDASLRRALCMVLPSRREGYGLVVVEAAGRGVPSVVVRDPDNAATELVEEGRNGTVAESAEPEDLAAAILRIEAAGPALRESTAQWFEENARRLSIGASLDVLASVYSPTGPPGPS